MKKKLIAVFLVVATLLSCVFAFAACDKDKGKDKDGKNGGAGETYTEEEIATLMGKLATYILSLPYQQMNLEVNPGARADENEQFLYNCEWQLACCIYVLKYDSTENATASIEKVKEEFAPMFEEEGDFTIEQHGAVFIVGGKNRIDAVRATEDKAVELFSQEFIDQYKANLKKLLSAKKPSAIQSFSYEKEDKTYTSYLDTVDDNTKILIKLANDATAEEIKAFNEKYAKKGYQKINEKLYFFEDKS